MKPLLVWIKIALIICVSTAARAEVQLPEDALGLVIIDQVTEGSLPFLHGVTGEGHYLTRNEQGELCQISPVRFLAGSLSGQSISVQESANSVELAVYSSALSERLKQGKKSVSAEFDVTTAQQSRLGDIKVLKGLKRVDGFILHPRKAWSSWFGFLPKHYTCEVLSNQAI